MCNSFVLLLKLFLLNYNFDFSIIFSTVQILLLKHLLSKPFNQSPPLSLENNIRVVGSLWGDQQVSIQHDTLIFLFLGNVIYSTLPCYYHPHSLHPLQPPYCWLPVDLKNHYQIVQGYRVSFQSIVFTSFFLFFLNYNLNFSIIFGWYRPVLFLETSSG